MKRSIASSIGTAFAFALLFHSAQWYDGVTNIVDRLNNEPASVEARIVDNYTDDDTGEYDEKGADGNRREIRQLKLCVETPEKCKAASVR